jgi:hypothetical protein
MATVCLTGAPDSPEGWWIIDSGASHHFIGDTSLYSSSTAHREAVSLAAGKTVSERIGCVTLTMMVDKPQVLELKNVLYVPNIKACLISTNRITKDHGIGIHLTDHENYMTKDDAYIGRISRKNGLYLIKCITENGSQSATAMYANLKNQSKAQPLAVWHRRLCHLGIRNVHKLSRQAEGILISNQDQQGSPAQCEHCANGKGHKQEYSRRQAGSTSPERAEDVGGRIHTDLKEVKFGTPERYFMIVVDEYTRYTWAFPLVKKSQAETTYKNFETMLFTQFGKRIKKLRCDNGGEYVSARFEAHMLSMGTLMEASIAYAHEQNGMAERHIRTVFEKVLSVLSDSKLPKKLWMEILRTVIYVKNRSPVRALGTKTPYEVLYGRRLDLSALRIPGCIAYAIIPREKRSKMDMHASRARYLGPEAGNQHRLYEERSGRVIFARDVVFDEDTEITEVPEVEGTEGVINDQPFGDNSVQTEGPGGSQLEMDCPREFEEGCKAPCLRGDELLKGGSAEPLAFADEFPVGGDAESSHGTRSVPADEAEGTGGAADPPSPEISVERTDDDVDTLAAQEGWRRSGRVRLPSRKLREALHDHQEKPQVFVTMLESLNEPETYQEAQSKPEWCEAMRAEHESLLENETWEEIARSQVPAGKQILRGKWVYTIKGNGRYKARWVVKGCAQRPGFDYDETYAAVSRSSSWRVLLAMAALKGWKIRQADITTAFLYGPIDHEIYAELPEGFEQDGKVCKLKKSIYGLKQAPKIWWETLSSKLVDMGFRQLAADPCVYTDGKVIIDVHVDDLLLLSATDSKIDQVVLMLSKSFKVKDLGGASRFLGIEIEYNQEEKRLTLRQTQYIEDVLRRFGMQNAAPKSTPMLPGERLDPDVAGEYLDDHSRERYQSAVGALNFLSCMTRPDLAFTMSILSKFTQRPQEQHNLVLQRTLRYLKSTKDLGTTYGLDGEREAHLKEVLYGYTDADYGGTVVQEDSRSTGGYVFMLGNGPVSWSSKRQSTTAISTTEAEYIGQFEAIKEAESLRMFLEDLEGTRLAEPGEACTTEPTIIHADNTAAITIATTPGIKARAKHLRLTLHWQRQIISEGRVKLQQVQSQEMIADGLTKPLVRAKHEKMLHQFSMT